MMSFLSVTAVLISLLSIGLSQRFLSGQSPNFGFRDPRQLSSNIQSLRAVAVLEGQNSSVNGVITFEQHLDITRALGTIKGLRPGQHGFHVHQFGDLTNGCTSAGGHYNPLNREHGSPEDYNRHAGDLGNIIANDNGDAEVNIEDYVLALAGSKSIIGRAIVVHENVDDLGRGGHETSRTTGNSGSRLACGVIGWAQV